MTISNQDNRISAVGKGEAQTVPFTFPIVDNSDILVESRVTATGVTATLSETTHYTVVNNGSLGGNITTVDPFVATASEIHITRNTPMTQSLDLEQGGSFNAENIEAAFDKTTKLAIENADAITRCLRMPNSDATSLSAVLPDVTDRAGLNLTFDFNGEPDATAAATTTVAFSSLGEDLVADDTEAKMRNTIGLDDADNYATFGAAITAIGSTETTLWVHSTQTVTTSPTVLETCTLRFTRGGQLTVASGQTVTINGSVEAGAYQVFSGDADAIDMSDSPTPEALVEWWGADPDEASDASTAFHAAIRALNGRKLVATGTYDVSKLGDTSMDYELWLDGKGQGVLDGDSDGDASFEIGANVDFVRVNGCKFQNFEGGVFTVDSVARTVGEFIFTNNEITSCDSGVWLNCIVKKVLAMRNRIWDLDNVGSVYGLGFGTNDSADEDTNEKFVISNNHIYDLDNSSASGECHAIIAYGREAIITNNTVDDITNSSDGGDAEGIYTKCFLAVIANNTLVDAGTGQASINIKGETRSGPDSAPNGYGVIVSNNTLYSTTGAYSGINIESEDVLCSGNYLEGFGETGIIIGSVAGDNILIERNIIRKHRGIRCILDQCTGSTGHIIKNNIMYDLLASQGTIVSVYGIQLQLSGSSTTANDVWIDGNYVFDNDTAGSTTNVIGIFVDVDATNTLNRLDITNNKCHISHSSLKEFGVYINIDGTLTTLYITGNDCAGVPISSTTSPILVISPSNITDFTVENNFFFGPTMALAAATNIEWYHTGTTFTNTGGGDGDNHVLPAAVVGLKYQFIALDDVDMQIDVDGTEIFVNAAGTASGAGEYVDLEVQYDRIAIECFTDGVWTIISDTGTPAFA